MKKSKNSWLLLLHSCFPNACLCESDVQLEDAKVVYANLVFLSALSALAVYRNSLLISFSIAEPGHNSFSPILFNGVTLELMV